MLKQPRVLACVLCQHRKIKCDRNTPCANCIKANVACTPSTPAPARKRRRPNQDLQERLARCEELLKQYANGSAPPPEPQSPQERLPTGTASEPPISTPSSEHSVNHKWLPAGKVVKEEGSMRFVDGFLWSTLHDELQAMKDIIETDEPDEHSILGSEDHSPDDHTDLFFPRDASSLDDLPPASSEVFRLWQLFLDRVNPVTKIIHVPTVQTYVIEALTSMENVPLNYQALLFSIYAMAVLSLSELECMQMLGCVREKAIRRYTSGIKRALCQYNFLKNHDMPILQALIFYMYSLQGRFDKHAAWIISGTILRIAQKMGYHRDGDNFDLDPYETEMRRRIWWQILLLDAKNAVTSGLSHGFIPVNWDTKEPSNVNDSDLIPGSRTPVSPREGATEMGFCIMMYRIANLMLSTAHTEGVLAFDAAILGEETEQHKQALEQYQAMVSRLEHDLEEAERLYIDPAAGGVHLAAIHIRTKIVRNLRELLTPMREQPEWGTDIFGSKDNMFKVLLVNTEHSTDAYKDMSKVGFLWFARMHIHLDVFAVMTGFLCQRHSGALAERAWGCIETLYTSMEELMDFSQKQYVLQAQLTLRAWKAREQAFIRAGKTVITPGYITQLQEAISQVESRKSAANTPTIPQQTTELDQFLGGGYMDVTSLNWDIWGDITANQNLQIPLNGYVRYNDSSMGNIGAAGAAGTQSMGSQTMVSPPMTHTSMGTMGNSPLRNPTLSSTSLGRLGVGNMNMANLPLHASPMAASPMEDSPMDTSPMGSIM
ncbi:fungal-specific transcription factor domain-containing protein [Stachybotrys elegans]|uniref:Fungal-specific transcription factor domain-containing protein n=1 Tax=Stachybotrys elegans TaxID=80388 RepID=A0A8K0WQI6_9HYPO|nr:fungal-specific transcription factor domain-containing protein [Stachybotrys elegans]